MTSAHFEVEQKFRVADLAELEKRLLRLGATTFVSTEQIDSYFAHPARDFSVTDEALRIRRVGEENFVTYKGPKIDATTKTRQEIELSLPSGSEYAAQFRCLLERLGFRFVAEVSKIRRTAHINWQGRAIEVALDHVRGAGRFIELELVVPEKGIDHARNHLADFATSLELEGNERRSYLELLLDE